MGHGSVRHLANTAGDITASYNYDAYGRALNFSPTNAATSLLYAGEMYDKNTQQYYLRARYYSPATGRFNRIDDFSGNKLDPQSLHKYLYAHGNPVNGIDPAGNMLLADTMSTWSIVAVLFAVIAVAYVANPALRGMVEDAAERQIKLLFALAAAMAMSLKQVFDAARDLVRTLPRSRRKEIYLHYSYKRHAVSLVATGLWDATLNPPEGSYGTRDIYLTGWWAKWFLALLGEPRTAVYIVWPKEGFEPTSEGVVPEKYDPVYGLLDGGGYQYIFRDGSGGFGTVFGPIPIPKGSPEGLPL